MNLQEYKVDTCIPLKNAWSAGKVELEALTRLRYPDRPMPGGMLPGVNSIGYWDSRIQQSWGFDWHRNEGIESLLRKQFFSIRSRRAKGFSFASK